MKRFFAKKQQPSLQWSFIRMVLAGWVLPVVLVVVGAGAYIIYSMTAQMQQSLQLGTTNAFHLITTRLDAVVVSSRVASYIPTIRMAWQSYQQDKDSIELYEATNRFIYQQYKYDEKFQNVIVSFLDLPELVCYTTNITAGGTTAGYRAFRQASSEAGWRDEAIARGTAIEFVNYDGRIYLVRNLVDTNYKPFAVLAMELNCALLFGDLSGLSDVAHLEVWLNDTAIPLAQNDTLASAPPSIHNDGVQVQRTPGNNFSITVALEHIPYTLRSLITIEPTALHSQQNATYFILLCLCLLLLPLIVVVLQFFNRKVAYPIQTLLRTAGEIEQGHFGVQVTPAALHSRELARLGEGFNTMSNTLLNQFERIYKEELALRDARIMALQSQINPHFLNNTLEIINWEARMNGDLKVCNMLESLSIMLEAAMDRKHRPLVHLSEEMMYADAYLYIIGERLGKRLTVCKEIDHALLDVYVPRLVLQPILENAIEHGISPTQKGTVYLRARREHTYLLLEVENDGAITDTDLARIRELLSDDPAPDSEKSASLGIRNVHQRLRILYGQESGLFVDITKKGNTLFSIKIELSQEGQEYPINNNDNHSSFGV